MKNQQQVWENEHRKSVVLPGLADGSPSGAVIFFVDFLKSQNINLSGKAVDVGCGKGRNAIFLAKQGFEVYAMDYVQNALDFAKTLAEKNQANDRQIHFFNQRIDRVWPFEENFFNFAVDCFSSIDIETGKGREICRNEMLRTLKPGGVALVAVVSADDELEKEIAIRGPGPEPSSVIWPNGKFQKNYSQQELKEFYRKFELLEFKEVKKPAFKLGKHYTATNYFLILRKPL